MSESILNRATYSRLKDLLLGPDRHRRCPKGVRKGVRY